MTYAVRTVLAADEDAIDFMLGSWDVVNFDEIIAQPPKIVRSLDYLHFTVSDGPTWLSWRSRHWGVVENATYTDRIGKNEIRC